MARLNLWFGAYSKLVCCVYVCVVCVTWKRICRLYPSLNDLRSIGYTGDYRRHAYRIDKG